VGPTDSPFRERGAGDHVTALLEMYKAAGIEKGALLTHGADAAAWTRSFALDRVPRPALRRPQQLGAGVDARAVVSEYTSNTSRRGGNTHAPHVSPPTALYIPFGVCGDYFSTSRMWSASCTSGLYLQVWGLVVRYAERRGAVDPERPVVSGALGNAHARHLQAIPCKETTAGPRPNVDRRQSLYR
jgi:hypothetical protein